MCKVFPSLCHHRHHTQVNAKRELPYFPEHLEPREVTFEDHILLGRPALLDRIIQEEKNRALNFQVCCPAVGLPDTTGPALRLRRR